MSDEQYAWEGKGLDEASAKELYLWIENDGDLYRQQYSPINKNLTIKKAQGRYDHDLAAKLFMYLADNGAKRYGKEVEGSDKMPSYFSKPVRQAVANELRDKFELEYDLGNYDQYIPKKYQAKKPIQKRRASASRRDTPSGMQGFR